jgi:mannitol/fructose-specific phosphotransferase system IIA component (Ntr-type)
MPKRIANILRVPLAELPASAATSCEAAIRHLIGQLVLQGLLDPGQETDAVERVLQRERVESTSLGNGTAIPHARVEVGKRAGIVGHSEVPIPWASANGTPVRVVCLWLTPASQQADHLRTLEATARALIELTL